MVWIRKKSKYQSDALPLEVPPFKFDLHVHSKYSYDSLSDPRRIIKFAKAKGLSGIAITDHNTIQGGLRAKKYEDPNFIVIVGSEIKTSSGEIIGLFLEEEVPANLSLIETIELIHDQNGIVVLPHPFDNYRKYTLSISHEFIKKFIDCIEAHNSRSSKSANRMAEELGKRLNAGLTAGSDAHTLMEIGRGFVCLDSLDGVRELLIKNKCIYGVTSKFYVHKISSFIKRYKKFIRLVK